jgi:hypothetical protein
VSQQNENVRFVQSRNVRFHPGRERDGRIAFAVCIFSDPPVGFQGKSKQSLAFQRQSKIAIAALTKAYFATIFLKAARHGKKISISIT